ncbi:MAG TPA: PucR family transcriptional regulator ligand-binding domain-containing protein [Candidatus Dormibacteraeota bacterium]|nr:PucR family transcriptional regulator ligand-binding domain-containing protein [Candidatus Dormibacteraeota bacterium]
MPRQRWPRPRARRPLGPRGRDSRARSLAGTGQVLFTTGYAWPSDAAQLRALIRSLAQRGLLAIGLAVPKYLEHFPPVAVEEARRTGLVLFELPWEIPFAEITEAVNGVIIAEQFRLIEQSAVIHREMTGAALEAKSLQDLARNLGNLIQRSATFEDADATLLGFCEVGEPAINESRKVALRLRCGQGLQRSGQRSNADGRPGQLEDVPTGPALEPAILLDRLDGSARSVGSSNSSKSCWSLRSSGVRAIAVPFPVFRNGIIRPDRSA